MKYWEDRLTDEQFGAYRIAIDRFRKKLCTQFELYDDLVNCGITSEEADEMCSLEVARA